MQAKMDMSWISGSIINALQFSLILFFLLFPPFPPPSPTVHITSRSWMKVTLLRQKSLSSLSPLSLLSPAVQRRTGASNCSQQRDFKPQRSFRTENVEREREFHAQATTHIFHLSLFSLVSLLSLSHLYTIHNDGQMMLMNAHNRVKATPLFLGNIMSIIFRLTSCYGHGDER